MSKQLPLHWLVLAMIVSKKVPASGGGNEYQEIGKIEVPYPTLKAAGVDVEPKSLDEEDGTPIYESDVHNWVFGAMLAQVKAQARNKLVSGTIELKDAATGGKQEIAFDWDTLTAEGERVGNAEALKLIKEVKTAFNAYVSGLNKSAQAQAVITGLFANKNALALQPDATKDKIKKYVGDFATSLDEKNLDRYVKYLSSVEAACAPSAALDDL